MLYAMNYINNYVDELMKNGGELIGFVKFII